MSAPRRPGILEIFFTMRGSIVPLILPKILLVAGLSALVVWGHKARPLLVPTFDGAPFALIGIALSIFLGFRNNACYDRWWEARRVWGTLIVATRNFGRQTLVIGGRDPAQRHRLLMLTIAFAQALVPHLRPRTGHEKVWPRLTPADRVVVEASANAPDAILRLIGADLANIRAAGEISDMLYATLDSSVSEMAVVQSACERIRGTQIPFGYTLLLHRTSYIFCFLLPFGFADVLGWRVPVITAFVAYTIFGLDALGDELEEPFNSRLNALPIEKLAETIETNLSEAMSEPDRPALV